MSAAQRIKALRAELAAQNLDAFLTFDPANQRWLTDWPQTFDDAPAHAVLIAANAAYLHTDGRYAAAMRARNNAEWEISDEKIRHTKYVSNMLNNIARLGIEDNLPLNVYQALKKELAEKTKSAPKIELVVTSNLMLTLRAVKDTAELDLLRKAQAITDAAFNALLEYLRPGLTELEVANQLEYTLRALGSEGVAFSSIVASGPNSARPHAVPTMRQLERGDFVVLDFGARYHDYCADMTRTVFIGKPSAKQLDIYDAVLEAHEQAKAAIKAGVAATTAHDLAANVLAQRGYEKEFLHSLGHGVGIEVHELPTLSPKNEAILQSGNVVTVEPGVYTQEHGGVRIEDFGVVTADSFKSFTQAPRELILI